ncbi:hypothetical protein CB1_000849051 [Camelus ferus]|nr:hypothetical protein CB1_000849051 [Camelus ferus]
MATSWGFAGHQGGEKGAPTALAWTGSISSIYLLSAKDPPGQGFLDLSGGWTRTLIREGLLTGVSQGAVYIRGHSAVVVVAATAGVPESKRRGTELAAVTGPLGVSLSPDVDLTEIRGAEPGQRPPPWNLPSVVLTDEQSYTDGIVGVSVPSPCRHGGNRAEEKRGGDVLKACSAPDAVKVTFMYVHIDIKIYTREHPDAGALSWYPVPTEESEEVFLSEATPSTVMPGGTGTIRDIRSSGLGGGVWGQSPEMLLNVRQRPQSSAVCVSAHHLTD